MASAKQIKARKEFAKRVKRGDFRKAISKSKKSNFDKDYEMVCHTCGKKGDLSKHNKRHKIGSQARSYSVGAEETAKAMGQQRFGESPFTTNPKKKNSSIAKLEQRIADLEEKFHQKLKHYDDYDSRELDFEGDQIRKTRIKLDDELKRQMKY